MYKIASFGLIAVLAAMVVPASFDTNSDGEIAHLYGYSLMSVHDASGVTLFENGVHNEVLSLGTDYILDVTFGGDAVAGDADADQVDAICINTNAVRAMTDLFSTTNETASLADWNDNDGDSDESNDACEGVTFSSAVTGASGAGSAVSSTATFNAASDNLEDGETIIGIAIGEITTATGQPSIEAPLFAMIDTSDVTVNTGETVDITYTMNLD